MLKTRLERRVHLKLNLNCIEIGGVNSGEYRGLLAHYLKTTIPTGHQINLCHACNNPKCSNVFHLYWGTPSDNIVDLKETGKYTTIFERTKAKYSEEEFKEMRRKAASKGGSSPRKNIKSQEKLLELKKLVEEEPKCWGWKQNICNKLKISIQHLNRCIRKF